MLKEREFASPYLQGNKSLGFFFFRVFAPPNSFLLVLYSPVKSTPEFWECRQDQVNIGLILVTEYPWVINFLKFRATYCVKLQSVFLALYLAAHPLLCFPEYLLNLLCVSTPFPFLEKFVNTQILPMLIKDNSWWGIQNKSVS